MSAFGFTKQVIRRRQGIHCTSCLTSILLEYYSFRSEVLSTALLICVLTTSYCVFPSLQPASGTSQKNRLKLKRADPDDEQGKGKRPKRDL